MTGIIILAAGESKRFGSPKQLADFRGKPLIRHAAETALAAGLGPVRVVLGAVDQPCRDALEGMAVDIVHHPAWREGMAGSIIAGLRPWLGSALEGVILLLADQPGVTADHLRALAAAAASASAASVAPGIVASHYEGQSGVPAWFSADKFPALLSLTGEKGAKALIAREPDAHWLEAPAAAFDVDTPADLARVPG